MKKCFINTKFHPLRNDQIARFPKVIRSGSVITVTIPVQIGDLFCFARGQIRMWVPGTLSQKFANIQFHI